MNEFNWVVSIASVLTALGVGLVWWQVRSDHERRRREYTIELVHRWTSSLDPVINAAEKLVGKFTEKQCRALAALEVFSVSSAHRSLLATCLTSSADLPPKQEAETIKLTKQQVTRLRSLVVSYLNRGFRISCGCRSGRWPTQSPERPPRKASIGHSGGSRVPRPRLAPWQAVDPRRNRPLALV